MDWGGMLRTTFRGTCPSCGSGALFRGAYALHPACPACGLDLRGRDGAHFGGPIALGYGIGGVAGLVVFALLAARYGFAPWVAWVAVGAVVLSILAAFRACKAWWTWWLFRAGELGARGRRRPGDG